MATGCRDLVVLIDVTMSMKPCMEALKKNISFLIETLENQKDHNGETLFPNWRVMIAGYRDAVANPSNWFVQFPFTNDVNQLRANLAHPDMECKGGGDEPESLLDALYKLTVDMPQTGAQDEPDGLKWRLNLEPVLCRKVIVFFTDASFKPVTAVPPGKTVNDIVDNIDNELIRVVAVCPNAPCYANLGISDRFMFKFYSESIYEHLGTSESPEAKRDSVDAVKKLEEVCGLNGESRQFKQICEIVATDATRTT
jgi:hypothetical protein